jgi:hypothetical protein
MTRISRIKSRNRTRHRGLEVENCGREDFDFHYSYEQCNSTLKQLSRIDKVVENWLLEDAPEEE